MLKHPDHKNTFCECFGPCALCEEYRKEVGAPKLVTSGPFKGFTKIVIDRFERSKEGLVSYQDDIKKILEAHSVKEK